VERIPAAAAKKAIRTRVAIVAGALALAASGLSARLFVLQVVEAGALQARAARQHRQVIEVGGRRGSILDREGREFAVSVVTSSLYAHPARLKDPDGVARTLAPLLGRPVAELRSLLRSDEPLRLAPARLSRANATRRSANYTFGEMRSPRSVRNEVR
jgi:stage V sporulation protein D (sporulation-specific penicillin-binding protein)